MVSGQFEMIPVKVECHSGYKADEYPVCFFWKDERYDILEIIDRWYQAESNPEWPVSDYFKVRTFIGGPYILKHEKDSDRWYLKDKQTLL
jgi:hypothetical protein